MMNYSQNIAVLRVADYNQLIKQPSVINSYFLTQQSANLIEDFVLEIGRG